MIPTPTPSVSQSQTDQIIKAIVDSNSNFQVSLLIIAIILIFSLGLAILYVGVKFGIFSRLSQGKSPLPRQDMLDTGQYNSFFTTMLELIKAMEARDARLANLADEFKDLTLAIRDSIRVVAERSDKQYEQMADINSVLTMIEAKITDLDEIVKEKIVNVLEDLRGKILAALSINPKE